MSRDCKFTKTRRSDRSQRADGAACTRDGRAFVAYAGAVVAANVRENGELVVIAASPAWANRLRYEEETLLAAAREAGLNPAACRVRVTQG